MRIGTQTSALQRPRLIMIRSSLFLILILAGSAFAQGPAFIISWAAVEQRVDGTYIDEPIAYRIYEATTGAVLCATPTTECIVQGQRGQCSTAYVTAILIESGMGERAVQFGERVHWRWRRRRPRYRAGSIATSSTGSRDDDN